MKRMFYSLIIAALVSTLALGAEVRKLGVNDLSYVDFTSPAGHAVLGIQPLDVRAHGAKGDGITDDTAAIASALTAAAGGVLFFPKGVWTTTAELFHNAATNGPITIMGIGGGSVLKLTGASNKGIHITGTRGGFSDFVLIKDLIILSATSGTSSAGIHLDGLANWKIQNVTVDGVSWVTPKITNGFHMTAAQQGEVAGGGVLRCTNGAFLEQGDGVPSNGIDWHGMTFQTVTTGLLVDSAGSPYPGGASDLFFHANHLTSASTVIDAYGDGIGMLIFESNHIEPTGSNNGIRIRNGIPSISRNIIYGTPGTTDIQLDNGVRYATITENLLDANVLISSGVINTLFSNNTSGGTVTNNGTGTIAFNNRTWAGNAFQLLNFTDNANILSAQVTPGDILLLNANPAYGGNWGMSIWGAGGAGSEVYLRLHDVIMAGDTGGSILNIKSGVGGTTWGKFYNGGDFALPVDGKGVVLTNAAGTVTKRVRLNDAGDGLIFEAP